VVEALVHGSGVASGAETQTLTLVGLNFTIEIVYHIFYEIIITRAKILHSVSRILFSPF
jgi:hypothetical protein